MLENVQIPPEMKFLTPLSNLRGCIFIGLGEDELKMEWDENVHLK